MEDFNPHKFLDPGNMVTVLGIFLTRVKCQWHQSLNEITPVVKVRGVELSPPASTSAPTAEV